MPLGSGLTGNSLSEIGISHRKRAHGGYTAQSQPELYPHSRRAPGFQLPRRRAPSPINPSPTNNAVVGSGTAIMLARSRQGWSIPVDKIRSEVAPESVRGLSDTGTR